MWGSKHSIGGMIIYIFRFFVFYRLIVGTKKLACNTTSSLVVSFMGTSILLRVGI